MSFADIALGHGNAVLFAFDSDEFTIFDGPRAGEKFRANCQVATVVSPELVLSEDKREKTKLYCVRPGPPLELDQLISGKGTKWVVVDREDNQANDTVNFQIVKHVAGKDL